MNLFLGALGGLGDRVSQGSGKEGLMDLLGTSTPLERFLPAIRLQLRPLLCVGILS